ncbi:MAG: zinc ribbon domain-containing protein [Candidatus Eremiobacteraeota bacterium]|nr:zinc ribbon domain-containing protein [Candidatus Eremiobacteraeota bacterium]
MDAFKCPKCGKTTGADEKFCNECGQPLDIPCLACGKIWRFLFDYKFCPECGHNLKKGSANKPLREEKK